ncbi:MAG: DUF3826 domain-containing protein [Bacteroidota bacterium]
MKYCLFFLVSFFTVSLTAQDSMTAKEKAAAYEATITSRAQKIVDKLSFNDPGKSTIVTKLVAAQYKNLNEVYTDRDLQVKTQKETAPNATKESISTAVENIQELATERISSLHNKFIADLSAHLTSAQVDQVKDGMTYGVLQVTYKGYNDMIPTLTDKQKEQIMTWLIEAREFAMDAESSEKKHGWFGKYKGRINNYLSAAGYNLQAERAGWQERLKAGKATKTN